MDLKTFLKKIKLVEPTISTLLGTIVVIIVGVLIFKYFQGLGKPFVPSEIKPEIEVEEKTTLPVELPATHSVQEGESLWKIALKYFNSGYNWVDIAAENGLKSPNKILPGMELTIPNVRRRIPLSQVVQNQPNSVPITLDNYSVVKGDSLWNIALRAYGDGFRWMEIAKVNKLTNPNIIHPGNVLTLPR